MVLALYQEDVTCGNQRDPRRVVCDPEARYFGGRVEERALVPLGEAPSRPYRFRRMAPPRTGSSLTSIPQLKDRLTKGIP